MPVWKRQSRENLGVPFEHVFSSDIDKHVQATIRANFAPAGSAHMLYEDMMKRDNAKAPGCELYIVGWPCQGSSKAGKRKDFKDSAARCSTPSRNTSGITSPAWCCWRRSRN